MQHWFQTSLQRGAKFREGMGNGLRLRVHPEGSHQPKTRKGNQIMKIETFSSNQQQDFSFRCCSHVCGSVFVSAPTPAAARDMVPFNCTVSGTLTLVRHGVWPSTHVINFGHANQLGAFTGNKRTSVQRRRSAVSMFRYTHRRFCRATGYPRNCRRPVPKPVKGAVYYQPKNRSGSSA